VINEQDVRDILRYQAEGWTDSMFLMAYPLSRTSLHQVRTRRTCKHVY
jgi:uncharacterized protein (DUF433 family)